MSRAIAEPEDRDRALADVAIAAVRAGDLDRAETLARAVTEDLAADDFTGGFISLSLTTSCGLSKAWAALVAPIQRTARNFERVFRSD